MINSINIYFLENLMIFSRQSLFIPVQDLDISNYVKKLSNDLNLLIPEKVYLFKLLSCMNEYLVKIEKILKQEKFNSSQQDNFYLRKKLNQFEFRSLSKILLNLN